ncbi:SDR family oxidoreductase [Nocardioides sp. 1609]|uniref:SDR family oxidoreductase n=1 Tax=Nocardioides sp. 1609 TaxID=2508327 RepID=UPI00143020BD|nr:SDR family oxidoreductase [Nocardioides sp. 1609]
MTNVLITGCSSGFGRLTALALANRGDRVFATVRTEEAAHTLKADAADLPLSTHILDVTDAASVDTAVAEVAALGRIDVLVNNAGYALRGPVESLEDAELFRQFDTNVLGVVRMIRAVVPIMKAQGTGTVINMSSAVGLLGLPFEGAYSASKHAVEGLSESLRLELTDTGVVVVLIEPGAFETGFVGNTTESAAFTADHPMRPALGRFVELIEGVTEGVGRAHPQAVVDAVVGAIDDPTGPFRRLVGGDAEYADAIVRRGRFEQYETGVQAVLRAGAN